MENARLITSEQCCWNESCVAYGQLHHGNIRKFGFTKKGVQRYQCTTCFHTFVATKGTIFYHKRHSQALIVDCLALLAERSSLSGLHRTKGVKEETVARWLSEAGAHVAELEALLLADYPLERAQLDALWTYVGHKGEKSGHAEEEGRGTFWRGVTLDCDTRLRVGRAIAPTEEEVAQVLMQQLRARGHPDQPPALATDGKGAYREAMVETWGQVPAYEGKGRPPTHKQAQPDWQYLQVIKHRAGQRLVGVTIQVVYGDPETVIAHLGAHTAYVERSHLTSRQMTGRLVRKTLSYSKDARYLRAACAWEDGVYNFTRPHKSLRQEVVAADRRWQPRSPAMAAGLADHLWSVKELLTRVVAPVPVINTN